MSQLINRYYVKAYDHHWVIRDRSKRDPGLGHHPHGEIVEKFPPTAEGYRSAVASCAIWNGAGDNTLIPRKTSSRRTKGMHKAFATNDTMLAINRPKQVPATLIGEKLNAALEDKLVAIKNVPTNLSITKGRLSITKGRPGRPKGSKNTTKRVIVVADGAIFMVIDTKQGKSLSKWRSEAQATRIAKQMNELLRS